MNNKTQKKLEDMDWSKITMPQAFVVLIIFLFVSEPGQIFLMMIGMALGFGIFQALSGGATP